MMDRILSLQMMSAAAAGFMELTSSESTTCSSESTGGCVIKTAADTNGL